MERSEPGCARDLPVNCQTQATELTALVRTLAAVRERRREWEALRPGRALLEPRLEARLRAVTAMGDFPLVWKLPLLRECLDEAWQVRLEAAEQLVREPQSPGGRALLSAILWDGDRRVRLPVALAIIGSDEIWTLDPDLFTEALTRIEQAEEQAAVTYVRPLLKHRDPGVRVAAVKAIAASCPPGNRTPELLPSLADPSEEVCLAAVDALQHDDPDVSIPQLTEAFKLPPGAVRRGAAAAVRGLLNRSPSITLPETLVTAAVWLIMIPGLLIHPILSGDLSFLRVILIICAVQIAWFGHGLVRLRKARAAALTPLLTALRELPEDAAKGEFARLLQPVEKLARDYAGQSSATRKAAREAAAKLRRIQRDGRDLPLVCSGDPDTESLPRVSTT